MDQCPICKITQRESGDYACGNCVARVGSVLAKANVDSFDYAAGLVSGAVIRFSHAAIQGDWITLYGINLADSKLPLPISDAERGLDVQISHIAWAIDAPSGS